MPYPAVMHRLLSALSLLLATAVLAHADVTLDDQVLGDTLGGWTKRDKKAAEYMFSGSKYRTYKPEITTTPDGEMFISLRIDHIRGMFSSDDIAMLEITVSKKGTVVSAQSSLALQGVSISSDVIRSSAGVGAGVPGVEGAAKVGGALMADLSSKLLREKIVEPGRVSYPSVLRHNYNLLCTAIRKDGEPVSAAKEVAKEVKEDGKKQEAAKPDEKPPEPPKPEEKKPEAKSEEKKPEETKTAENTPEQNAKLDIKPFGAPGTVEVQK